MLCPGTVNTRIYDAERNRPAELETGVALELEKTALAEAAFAGSMPASEVAERVFEAMREERFYVLTHPAWDEAVRSRVEAALARGVPPVLDFAELARRKAAGEQL